MKKIYILLLLTLMLVSSPLSEEKALELFESIKRSEYSWVISQWDNEMKIKIHSRSSARKSLWDEDLDPIDEKDNSSYYPKERGVF